MTTVSILVTGLLFGSLGYSCSRSVRPRWQLGLVLFFGANTSLVSVFGLSVGLSWAIRAWFLGLLAGVLIRRHPAFAR